MRIIKKINIRLFTILSKIKGANIGYRSSIYPSCDIARYRGLSMGTYSTLYKHNTIYLSKGGKCLIGNHSHISSFSYFLINDNSIKIGNDVGIGPFCSFFCVSRSSKGDSSKFLENFKKGDITIGNNVMIGTQCVILPGSIINDNVIIAPNSVVSGVLESGFIYAGSQAKKIKEIKN